MFDIPLQQKLATAATKVVAVAMKVVAVGASAVTTATTKVVAVASLLLINSHDKSWLILAATKQPRLVVAVVAADVATATTFMATATTFVAAVASICCSDTISFTTFIYYR